MLQTLREVCFAVFKSNEIATNIQNLNQK